jgi:Uma2 family endonuclease
MTAVEVLTPPPKPVRDEFDNSDHYEIVDGRRVELPPMSAESTGVAADLAAAISASGARGKVYCEMLITLPLDKERNRRPDVIFVSYERWPRNARRPDTNAWDILPELCVEVVSPNDRAEEIETKVNEYLRAGVSLVWVIYPENARVYVYESASSVARLSRADTLRGGTVLPGFELPLADLFLDPPPAPPQQESQS